MRVLAIRQRPFTASMLEFRSPPPPLRRFGARRDRHGPAGISDSRVQTAWRRAADPPPGRVDLSDHPLGRLADGFGEGVGEDAAHGSPRSARPAQGRDSTRAALLAFRRGLRRAFFADAVFAGTYSRPHSSVTRAFRRQALRRGAPAGSTLPFGNGVVGTGVSEEGRELLPPVARRDVENEEIRAVAE